MSGPGATRRAAEITRRIVAAVVLLAACFGFLADGRIADRVYGIVSLWQLFPRTAALLRVASGGALIAAGLALPLILLSAIFGRLYCAALCPLGTLQDLAAWLGRRKMGYRGPLTAVRVVAAVLTVSLALAGAMEVASWLDPWSLFGRFLSYGAQPLLQLTRHQDVLGFNPWATAGGAVSVAAILITSALCGRLFCNTLCPVGAGLGLLNRIAPLRVRMEASSCSSCGKCAAACPASCIDPASARIDDFRCVSCLACVRVCPRRAVRYGRARLPSPSGTLGMSRASFLVTLGGGAAALTLSALPGRGLMRLLAAPRMATTPPGSGSAARYLESCTACGLCAAKCPSKVLRPSAGRLGLRGLLVPTLDYSVSYCQYECTSCLDLCPSGALERMSLERKKLVKIGDATLARGRCIVVTAGTKCGACAEHCPTGAVRMVGGPSGLPEPVFDTRICIGCGACHHACPVRPERAITVSGLPVHRVAERPTAEVLGAPASGEEPSLPQGGFPF